jgi:hypothetical protein
MPRTTISVHRVSVSKDALASLPAGERNLLFLAGHVLNELNSLNKVFTWCLHGHPEESRSKLNSLAQGVQALVYARTLAGKVSEAWEALKKAYFRSKLAVQLRPLLHADAVEALASLKIYFGRSNPINRVRNSFAFHYSSRALGEHWEDAVQDGPFEAVFGGTIGNNLHLGAEIVANAALLRSVGKDSAEQNLQIFFEDVQSMANNMTTLLEGVTMLITERALGKTIRSAASPEPVVVTQSYSEVSVPYFCRPDRESANPMLKRTSRKRAAA